MSDILLFSGGIDSLSAWFYMRKPKSIYVDLHTKYSSKEIKNVQILMKICPELRVDKVPGIDFSWFETDINAYLPYRNLILAIIAAYYGDRIILAGIEDDRVEDKSPEAFKVMTNCLNSISKPNETVEIYSPFWNMSKSEIIRWMLHNVGNSEALLRASISCYESIIGQCGNCPSCLRKAVAFESCGLSLDFFENDVTKSNLIPKYIEEMTKPDTVYSRKRVTDSLKAFRKWGWL